MASLRSVDFSIPHLEKRLQELNTTLQSIQGVSQWLIHHRKHAKTAVSVWYKEVQKGKLGLWAVYVQEPCYVAPCIKVHY